MLDPQDFEVPDNLELIDPVELKPFAGEEVTATWRQAAHSLRQMYVGLIQGGFTPGQAWDLVRLTVKTAAERGPE